MSTTTPHKEKTFPEDVEKKLPKPFIMRRLHSILGLWLVIYLFEHLLVNSQAAFYFSDRGATFIRLVGALENIPYLPVVEIVFLALPFLIHGIWGVIYLKSAKYNAHKTDGSAPALPQYKRNRAYSWQRITSWILIPFIILHVIQMRLTDRPQTIQDHLETHYLVHVKSDPGLKGVVEQLNSQISAQEGEKVTVMTTSPGVAFFLTLRELFKSSILVILYSLFVVAACYHAFNGLWTFMITWGITLTRRSQLWMRRVTNILMFATTCMGLIVIWGVYWTTQFQM